MRSTLTFVFWLAASSVVFCGLASAGDNSAGNRVIRGTVVEAAGKPVRNAEVLCAPAIPKRFPDVAVHSGADGTFALTAPPADEFAACPDCLWVSAPGYGVAMCPIPDSPREQSSLRLILDPPSRLRVTVTQPDGTPAQNALLAVPVVAKCCSGCLQCCVPDALITRTTVTTDRQGVAFVPWSYEDVSRVDVTTPSLGRQLCYSHSWQDGRRDSWTITLLPAGRLRGRVVADGPCPVQGLTLGVWTQYDPRWGGPEVMGPSGRWLKSRHIMSMATVTTDSQGRFEVPTAVYGWARIRVINGQNKLYQHNLRHCLKFNQGDKEELTVRLRKASHVQGILRVNAPNWRPSQFRMICDPPDDYEHIPSTTMLLQRFGPSSLSSAQVDVFVNIDETGRFDFYSLPGQVLLRATARRPVELDQLRDWDSADPDNRQHYFRLPEQYATRGRRRDAREERPLNYYSGWDIIVPEGGEDVECEPFELTLGRGRVFDEKGVPIGGIGFLATAWSTGNMREGTTDEHGRFSVWLEPRSGEQGGSRREREYAFDFNWNGKTPQYASRQVKGNAQQLEKTDIIPDVVLPFRKTEAETQPKPEYIPPGVKVLADARWDLHTERWPSVAFVTHTEKQGPCTLKDWKRDDKPSIPLGKHFQGDCKFYRNRVCEYRGVECLTRTAISVEMPIKNVSQQRRACQLNVAFLDKEGKLVGCLQKELPDYSLAPGEKTVLNAWVYLPEEEIDRVASYQARLYETGEVGNPDK